MPHLPDTVVCDGTMIGFRKDRPQPTQRGDVPTIEGSKQSGNTSDRRKIRHPQQLTHAEFKQLCQGVRKDGLQIAGTSWPQMRIGLFSQKLPDIHQPVDWHRFVVIPAQQGSKHLQNSESHEELQVIQRNVPVFITVCPKDAHGKLSGDVRQYPGVFPSTICNFTPILPTCRSRNGLTYHRGTDQETTLQTNSAPPTQSTIAGREAIINVYCPHGYGFDVLNSCESPRHPFEIISTLFDRPPAVRQCLSPPHLLLYENQNVSKPLVSL